jgi:hypothetical protein
MSQRAIKKRLDTLQRKCYCEGVTWKEYNEFHRLLKRLK